MGLLEKIRDKMQKWLDIDQQWAEKNTSDRLMSMALNADYYWGNHRPQFKIRFNQADDNIFLNFTRLVVDRAVTLLLGNGIEFNLPGEEGAANVTYLDEVWTANKKDILLQKVAKHGSLYGTCYIKILPDVLEGGLPRLVALDPLQLTIQTNPEDIEEVMAYIIRYKYYDARGYEVARKQEITREINETTLETSGWLISDYISTRYSGGRWELMNEPVAWDFPFSPILHWQNRPNQDDVYGLPDIDDNVIMLQDRINFVASNISKIIRYHAHPKTWISGGQLGNNARWGADEIIGLQGENAKIANLEMQSDLTASMEYMRMLRQTLFDLTQTVDLDSVSDKLGALTNFGLRVLYLDAESKLGAKREVWEDALTDLNSRLLQIGGIQPIDGGTVEWPDVLPVNETESMQADKFDLDYKLASKQTVSSRRGYDFEAESELIQEEQATGDNVGAAILRAFNQGQ